MNNPNINPKTIVPPVRNLTNRSPLRRGFLLILLTLALALFAISQTSQAVTPLPDEGYPNGNTGEGHGGLFSLTTGSSNTAIGLGTLIDSTTSNRALWLRRYNGPDNGSDSAQAIAVSPDGTKVFVTGYSDGVDPGFSFDYATVAYDVATGRKLWLNRYNGSVCTDAAAALAVSLDGTKVFVTGFSGCLGTEDYATVAYDSGTGQELWVRRYVGPGHGEKHSNDEAYAVAVSPDGSKVFVTGASMGIGFNSDYATLAYDVTLNSTVPSGEAWSVRLNRTHDPNTGVTYTWIAGRHSFTNLSPFDVKVTDANTPGVLVLQPTGSTSVIEPTTTVILGQLP